MQQQVTMISEFHITSFPHNESVMIPENLLVVNYMHCF